MRHETVCEKIKRPATARTVTSQIRKALSQPTYPTNLENGNPDIIKPTFPNNAQQAWAVPETNKASSLLYGERKKWIIPNRIAIKCNMCAYYTVGTDTH